MSIATTYDIFFNLKEMFGDKSRSVIQVTLKIIKTKLVTIQSTR